MNRLFSCVTGGAVAAAAIVMLAGGSTRAQTPTTILACRNTLTGSLRQVGDPPACVLLVERLVAWPTTPPHGLPGPTGVPGAQGPAGPKGPSEPTIAVTGGRRAASGSGDDLPPIETTAIGKLVGSLPVDAGSYFVVATVSLSPQVIGAEPSVGSAACWLEIAGAVPDVQIASSGADTVPPVRQTITLSGAANVPSGDIQVRCADGIDTPAFWQSVRITAVRVTAVQTVSAGSE